VCIHAGYVMSYWNRPFFPEYCGDAVLNDNMVYDTMTRIAGSFVGISRAFKAIVDHYGWTHIVLVANDVTSDICWMAAKPFDEVFANNENYTFTWLRLGSRPTDREIDNVLQQIRSRTRGFRHIFIAHAYMLLLLRVHIAQLCKARYWSSNSVRLSVRTPVCRVLFWTLFRG